MKCFSILGTGWLGYSLASSLKYMYKVKVSFKTKTKKTKYLNEGLHPYLFTEDDFSNLDELLDTDYLFINFPPSKFKDYINFLKRIYENKNIKNIEKIIFISSTSIYPNKENFFNEDEFISNSVSQIVYLAEEEIKEKTDVIFRCAGLMGENRVAGKYFAGKSISGAKEKVNYVHKDDVINATKFIIEKNLDGIYNLCSPFHPKKEEIYLQNSNKFGFEKPIFKDDKEYKNRVIDSSKLQDLGFEYKYPNPIDYN